ncbi:30S ribosomal protein S7 [Candidatus Parcubacteria bacterium]|nr:30S ribosomal protein S7 [Candidatus Parcubacteria bacterium]
MRHPVKNRNIPNPDNQYNSVKLSRFINYVMLDGKKSVAQDVVYGAFEILKEKTGNPNPLEVFDIAIKNASPLMEVRSRRIGGANYQVPREVRAERRISLAMRWILTAARSRKGTTVSKAIAEELLAAFNNEGTAVTKKENTHKMAESNKAFAHFAW